MASLTITVSMKLEDQEPDGSKCVGCGDVIYLTQKRLFVYAGKKKISASQYVFCGSCADAVQDAIDKKG